MEKQQTIVKKDDLDLLDYFLENIKNNKLKTTMYAAFVAGLKRKIKEKEKKDA